MTPGLRSARRGQRGVAIITALVVVAAATVAVSAMLWRESIAVRKVENQAALGEARWLARSALEWARLVLLQDARTTTVDHLGEIWALPLAETRVTDDLATSQPSGSVAADTSPTPFADNDSATVSGRMRDAQARVNLTGLTRNEQVDEQQLAMLKRLLEVLNLRTEVADSIALAMRDVPRPANFDALAAALAAGDAMDAETAGRLKPYVVILPVPTPVNLNTASPEVLAACFTDLPLDGARALARSRDQAWFNQIGDAAGRLPGTSGQTTVGSVSITSNFFEVEGRVRVGRADLGIVALIEREQSGTTRVRSMVER